MATGSARYEYMRKMKMTQNNNRGEEGEAGFIKVEKGTKRGCGGIGHGREEGKTRREEMSMRKDEMRDEMR